MKSSHFPRLGRAVRAAVACLVCVGASAADENNASSEDQNEGLMHSCGDELAAGTLPMHYWVSAGQEVVTAWPAKARNHSSIRSCADLTWIKMNVTTTDFFALGAEGVVRDVANEHDCDHSALYYAVYFKEADGSWAVTGAGGLWGNFDSETGECNYDTTGFPTGWGTTVAHREGTLSGEYRVGFHQWTHNAPSIGHVVDYCPDGSGVQPEHCNLPVRFRIYRDTVFPPFNRIADFSGTLFLHGTDENDMMVGNSTYMFGHDGDDVLVANSDGSVMFGGVGNDMYTWGHSTTNVTIYDNNLPETGVDFDRLVFGGTVSENDISFSRVGDDLRVTLSGSSATLDVWDYFNGPDYQVERFELSNGTVLDVEVLLRDL